MFMASLPFRKHIMLLACVGMLTSLTSSKPPRPHGKSSHALLHDTCAPCHDTRTAKVFRELMSPSLSVLCHASSPFRAWRDTGGCGSGGSSAGQGVAATLLCHPTDGRRRLNSLCGLGVLAVCVCVCVCVCVYF